ncbi:MAG: hypothetical protein K5755_00120 [Clostridiales bacterium]|nr:hypothetical protein [Clostridiales bacterium]
MKKSYSVAVKAVKYAEIAIILLAISVFASNKPSQSYSKINEPETGYVLSVYDGRIAVFEYPDREPAEVFDVYISSLPYNEQLELESGIFVSDRRELQRLIEDYTS